MEREPINVPRAVTQHEAYVDALEALGCEVRQLPEAADLPDSVFVEDMAVVLDELAVIGRPGAESRREEIHPVARALSDHRILHRIEPPGTLEGGDVLRLGRKLFVGRSGRTNDDGIRQLRALVEPLGYSVTHVEVRACLHLKTAVTAVGADTVLLNPDWVDASAFRAFDRVEVDPGERFAANALRIGDTSIFPAAHPRTAGRLESRGSRLLAIDVSEIAKAEGGVTCCSILVEQPRA